MNQYRQNKNLSIVGITDGDPFDNSTWSGSSNAFFTSLKNHGCLHAGISGLPSPMTRLFFQCINVSFSIPAWKFKYHIDDRFYRAYTRKVRQELAKLSSTYTHTLQIYSHYDVPTVIPDKNIVKCAYQDGNLARLLDSPRGYPNISKRRIARAMAWERKVFSGLDIIFTFSEWLRKSFIQDYNINPEKIFVIRAGANIPHPLTSESKSYDGKTILFIGIDFERKGGKVLLEAFTMVQKKIKDARLIIVGPHSLRGLPENTECLGYISKNSTEGLARLMQAYREACVFVLPSLYEPFGVVFLEAMASGLPCIGTDNCAMPEIIDHGRTGFLVPPGDPWTLAGRIVELLQDVQMAKEMGANGKHKFLNNFTWDHVAQRVVKILREA
jgi:glycosyltransferase involved in cell wall biosynthesis